MAGICTASVSPNSCGHRTITIDWDGESFDLHLTDVAEPLTTTEKAIVLRLLARHLRGKGVTLAEFVNRCVVGDEATNVKQYDFLGPGNAVVKTNIGTAYVNVLPGANGERILVDFTGCTQMRIVVSASFPVGTLGPIGMRLVRDSNNEVLYENANISATPTGERELDTGWVAIPAGFLPGAEVILRVQAKSVTAADDPSFRRIALFTR